MNHDLFVNINDLFVYFAMFFVTAGPLCAGLLVWPTRSWPRKIGLTVLFYFLLGCWTPGKETCPNPVSFLLWMAFGVILELIAAGFVRLYRRQRSAQ